MRLSDICLGLDSKYFILYIRRKGRFLREPVLVARPTGNFPPLFGSEAAEALALWPDRYRPSRPFSNGMVADYPAAEALVKRILALAGTVFRPSLTLYTAVADPSPIARLIRTAGASSVECVSMCEGSNRVIPGGLTAYFGDQVMISSKTGGTTFSDLGSDYLCRFIARAMRTNHRILIGGAEALRALECGESRLTVTGRSLENGLPLSISLSRDELDDLIRPACEELAVLISDLAQGEAITLAGRPPRPLAGILEASGRAAAPVVDEAMIISQGAMRPAQKPKKDF